MFHAAAVQMTSSADRAANEARALALVGQAADRGAKLIGLPEVWEHVGPAQQKKAFAGPLEGRQLAALREFCTKRAVWLVAGSIAEREHKDAARIYNTTALISPQGKIAGAYRKMHLFDVDIPDGARYRESETVAPGPELAPAAELSGLGIKIGLSVCYDLRFPELYRKLSDSGADRAGALRGPLARAGHREPGVRLRTGPGGEDRAVPGEQVRLGTRLHRRPLGGSARGLRRGGRRDRDRADRSHADCAGAPRPSRAETSAAGPALEPGQFDARRIGT